MKLFIHSDESAYSEESPMFGREMHNVDKPRNKLRGKQQPCYPSTIHFSQQTDASY